MHRLVLDTNFYLHFRAPDEVPWHQILGVPEITDILIIVPGVVLREIDAHKANARLRDRARTVSARLVEWLEQAAPQIRPHVRIEARLAHPDVDYASLHLTPEWNDDQLIAALVALRREVPRDPLTFLTDDGSLRLRAREFDVSVIAPPEGLRLPAPDDDLLRENRALKRQIQQLQAVRPVLDLQFADSRDKRTTVVLPRAHVRTDSEIEAELARLAQQYPSADELRHREQVITDDDTTVQAGIADGFDAAVRRATRQMKLSERAIFGEITDTEFHRYGADRADFLVRYAEFLRAEDSAAMRRARQFRLDIVLANSGSAPASDVDVVLDFPFDLDVRTHPFSEEAPEPPSPPRRPSRRFEHADHVRLHEQILESLRAPSTPDFSMLSNFAKTAPRNVSSLTVMLSETGRSVSGHVGTVKHGLQERLPPLFIAARDDGIPGGMQIGYRLYAANVPEAVIGALNVIIRCAV